MYSLINEVSENQILSDLGSSADMWRHIRACGVDGLEVIRCGEDARGIITPEMVVCDVVFNPVRPRFLQEAAARGAKTVTGIGMLVQQGALNFELWTGRRAPADVMYDALAREFGAQEDARGDHH